MRDAKLFVIRKPHQGENVVENVLNYMIGSVFADQESIMTNEVSDTSFEEMLEDIYQVQSQKNMVNHRAMFHMVLSTRPSKVSQRILDGGAKTILDYFTILGHQVVIVPHDGSENNCLNYHYHIAVNPISMNGCRLLDKWETYSNIVAYLNQHTHNEWSWGYTTPSNVKKYF